ncbi:MAG: hypothetical protein ACM3H9_00790 [Rhodospirillaceae bacterium]
MTIEDWLAGACADAERRGLADLKPLLAALAEATSALRAIDWDGESRPRADLRSAQTKGPAAETASP